jgi:hypothetical protein
MKSRDEIIGAIIDQIQWSQKLGKIRLIDMDDVMDVAEQILTDDEYDLASESGAFRDVLWSM